ncbi:MAG: hypothetical protein H6558_20885, partial [Lewinellaceae bacterium]|nr:hypothetical protein [Lewinellaceae bacterium]
MKPIIDLIVPSDLEERKKRYHTTNILTAIIPSIWIGLHTIFFIANDIPILSELGIVVSVLMLSALYWASQRKYQLASSMTAFVHVIFIGAAMVILGWKSGMQFHFIPMGLNAQVNVKGSIKYKFVVGFLMFLLFLGATIYTSYYPPTFQLSVNLLNLMLFFNVALSLSSIPALNANVKTYEETEEKLLMSNALNEQLLYNILPEEVARELRETGRVEPARFEEVTIIFSDFKGFTNI